MSTKCCCFYCKKDTDNVENFQLVEGYYYLSNGVKHPIYVCPDCRQHTYICNMCEDLFYDKTPDHEIGTNLVICGHCGEKNLYDYWN